MQIGNVELPCNSVLDICSCLSCQGRRDRADALDQFAEKARRIQKDNWPKVEPTPAQKLLAEKEAELRELEVMLKVKEVEKKIAAIKLQIEEVK